MSSAIGVFSPLQGQETVQIGGRDYVPASEMAKRLNMKARWVQKGEQLLLSNHWTQINLYNKTRHATINNIKVSLGFSLIAHRGNLLLDNLDWHFTLSPILTPRQFQPSAPKPVRTIVIDAGHGGKDPGAVNSAFNLQEKALALDVAKRLRNELNSAGYRVVLTRDHDTFIELEERPRIANRNRADLFLSIHFNGHANSSAYGIETFAYTLVNHPSTGRNNLVANDRRHAPANNYDPWNTLLAYHIQASLIKLTGDKDRGLKRARFTVLRDIQCPAALIELGFLSHPGTARKIGTPAYRAKLAASVAQGVIDYHRRVDEIR